MPASFTYEALPMRASFGHGFPSNPADEAQHLGRTPCACFLPARQFTLAD
ncbi:hypothetical protein GCM10027090_28670 [Sinomonas soli]